MQAQTPPATAKVPNKVYRELLKAEAHLIIGTIATITAHAEALYQAFIQPPHVGRAADDRLFGSAMRDDYHAGVNDRVVSIVQAMELELGIPINQGLIAHYNHPGLDEFKSGNTSKLQGISIKIVELAAQL